MDLWISTLSLTDILLTSLFNTKQGVFVLTNISTGPTTITAIFIKKTILVLIYQLEVPI